MTIKELYNWAIDCGVPVDYELEAHFIEKGKEWYEPIFKGQVDSAALKVDKNKIVVLYSKEA